MEGGVQTNSEIDHLFRAGNANGFSAKTGEPMALRHVVALDEMCLTLCLDKQLRRDQIGVRVPIIGEKNFHVPSL